MQVGKYTKWIMVVITEKAHAMPDETVVLEISIRSCWKGVGPRFKGLDIEIASGLPIKNMLDKGNQK